MSKILRPGTLMYRVLENVVLFAVSLHMVLGCCLHRAHGHPLSSAAKPVCGATCPHHPGQDGQGRDPCDQRSGDQGCDHDRCVFTRAELDGGPQLLAGEHGLPILGLVPLRPPLGGVEAADLVLRDCGHPVRLHLLNQALLL